MFLQISTLFQIQFPTYFLLFAEQEMFAANFHGEDGLGDILKDDPKDMSPLQEEHAVSAINRLANLHKKELTIIAIGPLTNLALAIRFVLNLKCHDSRCLWPYQRVEKTSLF